MCAGKAGDVLLCKSGHLSHDPRLPLLTPSPAGTDRAGSSDSAPLARLPNLLVSEMSYYSYTRAWDSNPRRMYFIYISNLSARHPHSIVCGCLAERLKGI